MSDPRAARDAPLEVRVARPEERATVLELLTEAAERMAAQGNAHGWPVPFPEWMIAAPLAEGNTYLVRLHDGTLAGTVTLLWEDPKFWGPRPPDAGYIHRLAIRPVYAGRGYARAVLDWADGQVRARGREWLRLDTASSNARLLDFYGSLGFRRAGEVAHDPLRFPVTLFERTVVKVADR